MGNVFVSECCGFILRYIIADNGRYLYKQKRPLKPKTWQKFTFSHLKRVGFSEEDSLRIVREVSNRNNYYNHYYYRPPCFVAQECAELRS